MKHLLTILLLAQSLTTYPQESFDFEGGSLQGWELFPLGSWAASPSSPVNGSFSLRHTNTVAGSDAITHPLPAWDWSMGTITWRFKLRHGFNPSSGNKWGVFLTSPNSATGLIPSQRPSGYAVGVNLTGSDDTLRLYRVTNGAYSAMVSSAINWEQDIKTSGVGAIEVERLPNGTFTLMAATTGNFNDMAFQGSKQDNTQGQSGHFGILYMYTATAAGRLWVDDISFGYKPINTNNHDAVVLNPAEQIPSGVVGSLALTPTEAVDILRFTISDPGTSDGLPTRVTQLRFENPSSSASAPWRQTIGGIRLNNAHGVTLPIKSTYISNEAIEVEIESDAMVIPNGGSSTFTLGIYLNTNGIIDGSAIQVAIAKASVGWETHHTGSTFAGAFPSSIVSNPFTVSVAPTHLFITQQPNRIVTGSSFSIVAIAGDANRIPSITYTGGITLGLEQGMGTLIPPHGLVATAQNGAASWNGISYQGGGSFILNVNGAGLRTGLGTPIQVINDTSSYLMEPQMQVPGSPLTSLVNTPGKAVEVFRFSIMDTGTNDGLPTEVSQIVLTRPPGDSLASYSSNIGGVILRANGQPVPIGSVSISAASLTIPLPPGAIVVSNGQRVEVSVSVFLRGSGLEDKRNLVFSIPHTNHKFAAFPSGSTFVGNLPNSIASSLFPVDVIATRLTFGSLPQSVGVGEPFAVSVLAVDEGGNLDQNAQGEVNLGKGSGGGWLTIPTPNASLVGGVATWNDLAYFAAEPFSLLAKADWLNDAVSGLIYCADATSTPLLPIELLSDREVSSLCTDPDNAFEALSFLLADPGTTDGLPTHTEQLTFHSFGLPSSESLASTVGGVVVRANGRIIPHTSYSSTGTTLTVTFAQGLLTIPNSDTLHVTLSIYLKKGGLSDGSTIKLHIPASGHGFRSYPTGSRFAAGLIAGITGPTISIAVECTSLVFTSEPIAASPLAPFNLVVAATDRNGNVDTSAAGNVILSLELGPKVFITPSRVVPLTSGSAQWNGIQVGGVGAYRFRATLSDNPNVWGLSRDIWCGLSTACPMDENFEGEYPLSLPFSTHWEVSTVSAVDGVGSLRHALKDVAGESNLWVKLNIEDMGLGAMGWELVLRNGNWTPSSANAFWFVLASDSESVGVSNFNGYAIGVNLAGSTNALTLWRVNKGASPTVVIQTDFIWGANETVGVRVARSPRGQWDLWVQPQFGRTIPLHVGSATDTHYSSALACGTGFRYTTTRAGELWLDNLRVCQTVYPPVIRGARILSLTSILLEFNQPMNTIYSSNNQYYKLRDSQGQSISILGAYPTPNNNSQVTLRTSILPIAPMMLTVKGVKNPDGLTCSDSVAVGLGTRGTLGSVVINEIMARPSPMVGLPNWEYIELYNNTSEALPLHGWRLRGNNQHVNIPNTTIEPNGYIILCGTAGVSSMSPFGPTVGVASFPNLLVEGMLTALYDDAGNAVSLVEYTDGWYADGAKASGGYSLERIDPTNLMEGASNWLASNDPSGGTPGRENSVRANNPDVTSPRVSEVRVVSPTQIDVTYTEPMDSLTITLHSNYTLSEGKGNPLWVKAQGPRYNRATLILEDALVEDVSHSLCFDSSISDFAGNPLLTQCLPIALPSYPTPNDVVVNEILFNPFSGGVDFVELYNRSTRVFDLSTMWIASRDANTLAIKDYYTATDTAKLLFPSDFAVLTANPQLVMQFYHTPNPHALISTPRMPTFPNDKGWVLLMAEHGDVIDELAYTEKMHFPLLTNTKGVSLERIHPDLPSSVASTWHSAAQAAGFGTPTGRNSQHAATPETNAAFSLSSRVFSPDADGIHDLLLIEYALPQEGYTANVLVFDARGRLVRRLAKSITLSTQGIMKWDGLTDDNRRVSYGAYVVLIEAFSLKGDVQRYRLTCAVAGMFNSK